MSTGRGPMFFNNVAQSPPTETYKLSMIHRQLYSTRDWAEGILQYFKQPFLNKNVGLPTPHQTPELSSPGYCLRVSATRCCKEEKVYLPIAYGRKAFLPEPAWPPSTHLPASAARLQAALSSPIFGILHWYKLRTTVCVNSLASRPKTEKYQRPHQQGRSVAAQRHWLSGECMFVTCLNAAGQERLSEGTD